MAEEQTEKTEQTEEQTDGAANEQIGGQDEQQSESQAVSAEDVKKMLDDERKKWQGRFDKILAEKKAEENKAMTTEQRIEQLEEERKRERLEWSRKEAKAQAQLDDEMESAILKYASDDPDEIANGAKIIRELFGKTVKEYQDKIDDLEKQVKYTGKPPAGGGSGEGAVMSQTDFNQLSPKDQAAFMNKGGKIEG